MKNNIILIDEIRQSEVGTKLHEILDQIFTDKIIAVDMGHGTDHTAIVVGSVNNGQFTIENIIQSMQELLDLGVSKPTPISIGRQLGKTELHDVMSKIDLYEKSDMKRPDGWYRQFEKPHGKRNLKC